MSDVPPVNLTATLGINAVERDRGFSWRHVPQDGIVDQVEISELAQRLSALAEASPTRAGKVAAIREAIASGTYETPEKIDRTIDRLLRVLILNN